MFCCRWLAPEILAGLPYTVAADVYSFGIIMWELLTWEVRFVLIRESLGYRTVVTSSLPRTFFRKERPTYRSLIILYAQKAG